ncbi:DUF3769 domain-containing protein [Cyanobium sp. HWJ4-Hawea]|uniref:DUF3769 domain-containing protein n=1 Tax=Cyanobium sp. HWJ4-Hawea TaxID=2823713 RepID=UPI0020CC1DD8|nr:DUF3769 domain-containing protein [Cyanobium sp. HWJ4-Hawea]MCP9808947.1 DUF3769 domain-containing protein [Cyanobium sp. HWJ4-Hawea]
MGSLVAVLPSAQVWAAPKMAIPMPGSANTSQGSTSPSKQPATEPITPGQGQGFVNIRADKQGFDGQLNRYVATGKVRLQFNGWTLLADRLEVEEKSRSFYATGQVRLRKGDQYLQASSIRYSYWEGIGELEDVYGVIDQDTLKADTSLSEAPDTARTTAAADIPFVCPPLQATGKSTAISLIPPSRVNLPVMAAGAGCPGSQGVARPKRMQEALEQVAFKQGAYEEPALINQKAETNSSEGYAGNEINQRVRNVQYQRSFNTGIKVNFSGLIGYTTPSSLGGGSGSRSFDKSKDLIRRIRFQSSNLRISKQVWTSRQMAFTNDPFTPARSWTMARNVTAAMAADGSTKIWARNGNIILENKLSLPAVFSTTLNQQKPSYAFGVDNQDRDGFFVGYNVKPIQLGSGGGTLKLQPQLLLERAISGQNSSFVAKGASLASPTVTKSNTAADDFGLIAITNLPIKRFNFNSFVSLSTLNPENIPSGTRSVNRISTPLKLPLLGSSSASAYGNYRERIYNGSLGQQTLVYSYGLEIGGSNVLQTQRSQPLALKETGDISFANPAVASAELEKNDFSKSTSASPFFQPINFSWNLSSGNFQATLFDTGALATLWRTTASGTVSSGFSIWKGKALSTKTNPIAGLNYSATAITPGLSVDFGASGLAANYGDGSNQNTITFFGGPSLTLGHFEKPFFDYTRLSASISGTFLGGISPFGFDRSVDNRTISFAASQQIYGPLVVEGGATYNIDPNSIYYGNNSYSYIEVKWQRRSYELGVYYSPYDGIGGIRVKLNDFDFDGTGVPFVPTAPSARKFDASMPIQRRSS